MLYAAFFCVKLPNENSYPGKYLKLHNLALKFNRSFKYTNANVNPSGILARGHVFN